MSMEERLDSRLSAMEAVIEEIKAARQRDGMGDQCTAEVPHGEGLNFTRGSNLYVCRCGKR